MSSLKGVNDKGDIFVEGDFVCSLFNYRKGLILSVIRGPQNEVLLRVKWFAGNFISLASPRNVRKAEPEELI